MKFQCKTKSLQEALNLGVINSNVSNFHKKSCIVQVTASDDTLRINIEASMIYTELTLKGVGSGEASIFVDSLLFKQLMNTLDTDTVTLSFDVGGLIIESGKSKFTLPKMIDVTEIELTSPELPEDPTKGESIDKSGWRFVKDNQMYAISLSFNHPVYTHVWVGESSDVLVGDFDASLFTHSKKVNIGKTCLLTDTIVNLLNSLPESAKIHMYGDDYIITCESDTFSYVTQFTPLYESSDEVGSYNADIFLELMEHPSSFVEVETAPIVKLLNQSILLSSETGDTILLSVDDNVLKLKDNSVDGHVDTRGDSTISFELEFPLESIKSVLSNYEVDKIRISPLVRDDETAGILVWDDDLTTIIAGVE